MPRGGKREGAGRKPGIPNRRTTEIYQRAEREGIMPLDVMLNVMRECYAKGDGVAAASIAKDAAPYIHARLTSVQQVQQVTVRILDEAELAPSVDVIPTVLSAVQ